MNRLLLLAAALAIGFVVSRALGSRAAIPSSINRDSVAAAPGIAALHRADSIATIHGVATELRDLWDSAAVRIAAGPPAIGRAAIYKEDSIYRANNANRNIVRYVARYPTLSVHGNTAVEWGGFEATNVMTSGVKSDTVNGEGTAMRVMTRQADGSWKFSLLVL
ncbi:MAG: hypothetical protein ACREPM_04120, partial [Gemmatimonadaceae bacterium]